MVGGDLRDKQEVCLRPMVARAGDIYSSDESGGNVAGVVMHPSKPHAN